MGRRLNYVFFVACLLWAWESQANSLRVVWWNVQFGYHNRVLAKQRADGVRPLDANLVKLARMEDAPDVIALGEYTADTLDVAALADLKQQYPYSRFTPYSERSPHRGILFLSRRAFEVAAHERLDYAPQKLGSGRKRAYRAKWKDAGEKYYRRTYERFALNVDGFDQPVNIVPVHTAQPWEAMAKKLSPKISAPMDRFGIAGLVGKARTAVALAVGGRNPLINQLTQLRHYLERDLGDKLDSEPLIVLGDFNAPKRVGPITTRPYRKLAKHTQDAFAGRATPDTWPAASVPDASQYPSMKIDHAFVSQLAVDNAQVLALEGSDHYPIMVTVAPKVATVPSLPKRLFQAVKFEVQRATRRTKQRLSIASTRLLTAADDAIPATAAYEKIAYVNPFHVASFATSRWMYHRKLSVPYYVIKQFAFDHIKMAAMVAMATPLPLYMAVYLGTGWFFDGALAFGLEHRRYRQLSADPDNHRLIDTAKALGKDYIQYVGANTTRRHRTAELYRALSQ